MEEGCRGAPAPPPPHPKQPPVDAPLGEPLEQQCTEAQQHCTHFTTTVAGDDAGADGCMDPPSSGGGAPATSVAGTMLGGAHDGGGGSHGGTTSSPHGLASQGTARRRAPWVEATRGNGYNARRGLVLPWRWDGDYTTGGDWKEKGGLSAPSSSHPQHTQPPVQPQVRPGPLSLHTRSISYPATVSP